MAEKKNIKAATKKIETTEIKTENTPLPTTEILIQAYDDGRVNITTKQRANLWVIIGILAKALHTINMVQIQNQPQPQDTKIIN